MVACSAAFGTSTNRDITLTALDSLVAQGECETLTAELRLAGEKGGSDLASRSAHLGLACLP